MNSVEMNKKGTITFGDGTKSKVTMTKQDNYSSMPSDYWFVYQEGETNRPLVHPMLEGGFLLPEVIMHQVFKED